MKLLQGKCIAFFNESELEKTEIKRSKCRPKNLSAFNKKINADAYTLAPAHPNEL